MVLIKKLASVVKKLYNIICFQRDVAQLGSAHRSGR